MIDNRSRLMVKVIAIISLSLLFVSCSGNKSSKLLKIATTTSLDNSGLLAHLVTVFEEEYNVEVDIIASGTGQAIEYGMRGDVDMILVHAVELEKKFVAEEFGISRNIIMRNDFIVLGPLTDPAKIKNESTASNAFSNIAKMNRFYGDPVGFYFLVKSKNLSYCLIY